MRFLFLTLSGKPKGSSLEVLYHVFACLKNHLDMGWIACDWLKLEINESAFHSGNWSELYGVVQEEMPPKMPKAGGNPVTITAFVDSSHAGNFMTIWLHTGIISMYRMLQFFGTVKDRIQSRQLCSEVSLLLCDKICTA
jgi:hypothetical protein